MAPDLYNDLMDRLAAGSRDDLLLAERLRVEAGASTLKREAATRAEFYVTFGVQYGDLVDAQAALDAGRDPLDPHPTADWATGKGYLTVEFGLSTTDLEPEYIEAARDRALAAVHSWLDGVYATAYSERPDEYNCPRGEVARMVLP